MRARHAVLGALIAGLLLGPRAGIPVIVALAASGVVLVADRRIAVLAAVAFVGGAAFAAVRLDGLEATHLPVGQVVEGAVTITQAPRASPWGGWSAVGTLRDETVLLRVRDRAPSRPSVGDIVSTAGRLRAPGSFARSRGAHAELSTARAGVVGRRGGVSGAIDGVRRRAEAALRRGLPPPQAALFTGMALGDDSDLPETVRNEFRASGLTHLVAASGANIALLCTFALAIAVVLRVPFTVRWSVILGCIGLYVVLAGAGPSIQRAGVMGAVAVVALLAGRPSSRLDALAIAAVLTLAADPRAAVDPGWQLSFVAVIALLTRASAWREGLVRRKVPGPLADALAVTLAASIATAPVLAMHFDRVSIVALPANLVAAVVVAPVMWLGFAAALIGQVSVGLAEPLTTVAGVPLGFLLRVAHAAARAPGATLGVGPFAATAGALAAVCAVESLLSGVPGSRSRRLGAVAVVLTGALVAVAIAEHRPPPPAPTGLRVTFLDVGQGDATLVQAPGATILVDTGPPDGGVVARVRAAGVRRLDLLVVTHNEIDHAGGMDAVLGALPVALLLDGRDDAPPPSARVRRVRPDAGTTIRVGPLLMRVLWPRREPAAMHAGADPNDRAIVAEVDWRGARVLLTADAESPITGPLAIRGPFDIVKVAHHGSDDPGLPSLLTAWTPWIAGIEVGKDNTYGHPTPSTLAALRGVPRVVRTDRDGTVRADLVDGRWEIRAGG